MRRHARRVLVGWEALRALPVLAFIEFGLRTGELPRLCRRLGLPLDLDSGAPPATSAVMLPRGTRHAVRGSALAVAHWPGGDTCLRRCLALGHRLRGLGPVLRIGVGRRADGTFTAHSWLELDGATLDPAAAGFASLGPAGR